MTKTLNYYNQCAQAYNETTLNIEFDSKREMLLKYLQPNCKQKHRARCDLSVV